jgi:hypothetical protein
MRKLKATQTRYKPLWTSTGAGAFGLDRDPIQANPGMRYVIQFASQPYRVARLMKKWAGEKNFGAMGTFLAATALTSGSSAVPTVVHELMERAAPQTRALLYCVEDALDSVNVVNKVFGRDLRDKMQYDLIPILGGAQANLVMDTVMRNVGDVAQGKMDKVGASVMLLALSSVLGGGGVQIGRIAREAGNAQRAKKLHTHNRQVTRKRHAVRLVSKPSAITPQAKRCQT